MYVRSCLCSQSAQHMCMCWHRVIFAFDHTNHVYVVTRIVPVFHGYSACRVRIKVPDIITATGYSL